MEKGGMQKGMTDKAPKPYDSSTGPKAVSSGSVNDDATRKNAPTVRSPGPRTA